jgi:glycosyltransferase involved in cell wall biosynthesis
MKVLHIINSFVGGGAEKTVLYLHESYLNQGIESHALALMGPAYDALPNTHSLELSSPYHPLVLPKLYAFLRQPKWRDCDVMHAQLFPAQFFMPIATKALGIKATLITTEQGSYNQRRNRGWGKVLDSWFYQHYDKITCVSEHTLNNMMAWQPQSQAKLMVIQNGVDYHQYALGTADRPARQTPIIASVARLAKQKNYETTLDALAKLQDVPFEYWIFGTGELEAPLKEQVASLGIGDKVKFLGFRDDIPQMLNQVDIFLLASHWEGLSLAMVEAMAAGLPVVVSDIPEAREAVVPGSGCGVLVDPNCAEDIASKLRSLLIDSELRQAMGHRAQLRASEFDMSRVVQEYLNLYQQAIA